MKTNKNISIKIFALLSCLAFLVGTILLIVPSAKIGYSFSEIDIKTQYMLEDVIDLPEGEFTVDGKEYKAETLVYSPNGNVKKTNLLRASECGNYKIEYRAQVDGKLYSKVYKTNVVQDLYSVSSSMSKAEYKLDDSQYQTGMSGIHVTLAKGNTFTYNKVIDLREIEDEVVSLFVLPKTYGKRDITDILVTLTDAYDSKNRVVVQMNAVNKKGSQPSSTWNVNAGMMYAGFSEYMLFGRRREGDDGTYSYMSANSTYRYSFETQFSFSGSLDPNATPESFTAENCTVGKQFVGIKFDFDKGQVIGKTNNERSVAYDMIADLTDKSIFPEAWEGFTTGEVYLSVKCDGYTTDKADIMINKIGNENLDGTIDSGAVAPNVKVDFGDYTLDNIPVAKVGKEYPLFSATASDYNGTDKEIQPRVYFNYASPLYTEVDVLDGAFIPDRIGDYTIIYKVIDAFGQIAEQKYVVKAIADQELAVSVKEGYANSAVAGKKVQIGDIELSNASGIVAVDTVAILGENEYVIQNGEFVAEKSGEYQIKYTVTDYLGHTASASYTLNVSVNQELVAFGQINVPKNLIEGKGYKLPDVDVLDLSVVGQSSKATVKVKVIDGDGEKIYNALDRYVAKANSDGVVKMTFLAQSGEKTLDLGEKVIPVIDTSCTTGIDATKYFDTYGDPTVTVDNSGILYSSDQDFAFKFIKPVVANKFTLQTAISMLEVYENTTGSYILTLMDSVNSDERVDVRVDKKKNNVSVYINGRRYDPKIEVKNTTYVKGMITFAYRNGSIHINDNELVVGVEDYFNGEKFNGFSSGLVIFGVSVIDISGENAIKISMVNNQSITRVIRKDNTSPEISINGSIKKTVVPGDVVTVYDAFACDVLDTETSVTLTVTDPDGAVVTANDGTVLNGVAPGKYEFDVTMYGTYQIKYYVEDSAKNGYTQQINVASVDLVAPQIVLSGTVKENVKLKTKISVPNASVVDNVSGTCTLKKYAVTPLNVFIDLDKVKNAKFNEKGMWKIVYLAYDEAFNETVLTFIVNVK